MPRNRHVDRALDGSKGSIWIATGVILAAGAILLLWLASPSERGRREDMEDLALGDSIARVETVLGRPAVRCRVSNLAHLAESFPPGWPVPSVETTLQALARETRERWVYPVGRGDDADCSPLDGQTELGVNAEGRLLWYVAITGETPLELPERFAPAAPAQQ